MDNNENPEKNEFDPVDLKEIEEDIEKMTVTIEMNEEDDYEEDEDEDEDEDEEDENILVEPNKINKMKIRYIQWSSDNGVTFFPCSKTHKKLTPGFYETIKVRGSLGLQLFPVKTDELIRFPDSVFDRVIDEITTFWDRGDVFEKYGLIHKRGLLLYGKQGGGKSCLVQLISEDVIKRGGIVLKFTAPMWTSTMLKAIREIQPNTPIVVLMEDIDAIIAEYCESDVLNILDGVDRVDKSVFVATTNYPERLPQRLINRPSRFDKRFEIGYPNESSRRIFFEHLFSKEKKGSWDIDKWVEATDKMSFAHLKELFVASVILGDPFEEALATLREMMEKELDSEKGYEERQVGFGRRRSLLDKQIKKIKF